MDAYIVRVNNVFTVGKNDLTIFASYPNQDYHLSQGEAQEFEIPLTSPNDPAHFLRIRVLTEAINLPDSRVKLPSIGKLIFIPETEIVTSRFQLDNDSFLFIPSGPPQWELHVTGPTAQFAPGDGEDGPDNISVGENGEGG